MIRLQHDLLRFLNAGLTVVVLLCLAWPAMAAVEGDPLILDDNLGTDLIMRGTLASRPAAGTHGRLYWVTDAGSQRLTRDNGTLWDDLPRQWTAVSTQTLAAGGQINCNAGDTYIGTIVPVQGSGGAITLTSNPQIVDGLRTGQVCILEGIHATNSLTIVNGNGLVLRSSSIALGTASGSVHRSLALFYNGTDWIDWSSTVAVGGGGGTPAGVNTTVQYNANGAFGGDAQLTWNDSANVLTVTGAVNATTMSRGGQPIMANNDTAGADLAGTYPNPTLSQQSNNHPMKAPARVVMTTNVTISNPGTSVFDTITLTSGDRVLLAGQSTQSQNGLYAFNGSSSAMTRTTDADSSAEFVLGVLVPVRDGATAPTLWQLSNTGTITLGTTAITFERVGHGGYSELLANKNADNGYPGLDNNSQIVNPGTVLGAVLISQAAAPAAGSCPGYIRFVVQTGVTPARLFYCNGILGSNPIDVDQIRLSFNQITDGTNVFTCNTAGGCSISAIGADASMTTAVNTGTGQLSLRSKAITHATDCTAVTGAVKGQFCFEEDANTVYVCETADGNCNTAGEWTLTSGGGGTQTVTHPMQLMTVRVTDANAFVDTFDATNFDYSGVRFLDAVTGCAYYKHKIAANLGSTPAWALVLTHKAVSGTGGNVVLTVRALDRATNVALDSALTALHSSATFSINTSANTTITTLTGTNYDGVEPIAAGNLLIVEVCREGGSASDALNADYLILSVDVRYVENS